MEKDIMEKDIKVIDPYMAWAPKAEGITYDKGSR